jgi:D-tyrosyl-tRNA(Tyr) deacylase
MRAVIQRVREGRVSVEGQTIGEIGHGLVILLGAGHGDGELEADRLADKIANLRIFADAEGKTNLSILDVGGGALVISQFTLYADCRKGRRPSFVQAAPPDTAAPLVDYFAGRLRQAGVNDVETGKFGAMMLVEIQNDGPFTIVLDTDHLRR